MRILYNKYDDITKLFLINILITNTLLFSVNMI